MSPPHPEPARGVPEADPARAETRARPPPTASLRDITLYFLRLGTFGFGGPIALAGYMQRDLVEKKRWISKQDYVEWAGARSAGPRASGRAAPDFTWTQLTRPWCEPRPRPK